LFKRVLLIVFVLSISLSSLYPGDIVQAKEELMPITSKMYGSQYKGKVSFDTATCFKDYERLNRNVTESKIEDFKIKDEITGLEGKLLNIINESIFRIGQGLSNLIAAGSCYLGFAPSQLIQLMFFPIVLDEFLFLDTISTSVRTISVLILTVITVMAIMEMRKNDGEIGEELISKSGLFLMSVGIIAFSKFILQGIFDIANILSYYVSNYSIDIAVDQGKTPVEVSVNLLNLPTIFITYLDFSFSPDVLNKIPQFNLMMVAIMTIVKIIILIFITKDLLRIAVYGVKRMITLISSAVILPILAALIPSYRTQDIFNRYFRMIIASAFAPILFGLIYLSSAPFVIEDLVRLIEAPLLKVVVLTFFLNIIASIPDFVDGLIGSSNTITNKRFESGVNNLKYGSLGSFRNEFQSFNRTRRSIEEKLGYRPTFGHTVKEHANKKYNSLIYGRKR
jgi:hypothetical protein